MSSAPFKRNVLIVGGGAGGSELAVSLARKSRKAALNVTLVDDDERDRRARLPPGHRRRVDEAHGGARGYGGIALYLASRASSFVCGAVIPVDGGLATTA